MKRLFMVGAVLVALASGLTACTNPYDPGQRALGGAAIGAGSGAAIGAIDSGGRGAAIGALAGGVLGALVGAATTPQQGYDQAAAYYENGYDPRYDSGVGYYGVTNVNVYAPTRHHNGGYYHVRPHHRSERHHTQSDSGHHRSERHHTQSDSGHHRSERRRTQSDSGHHRSERRRTQTSGEGHRAE